MMKFETVSEEEKIVKTEKSVERLEQKREGMMTNNEILEAATREIVVAKRWQIS